MKVSGRRCESLELNAEDRERIEEIKRELLLNTKNTKVISTSQHITQKGLPILFIYFYSVSVSIDRFAVVVRSVR